MEKLIGFYYTLFLPERTVAYCILFKYRAYLDQSPASKTLITLVISFLLIGEGGTGS